MALLKALMEGHAEGVQLRRPQRILQFNNDTSPVWKIYKNFVKVYLALSLGPNFSPAPPSQLTSHPLINQYVSQYPNVILWYANLVIINILGISKTYMPLAPTNTVDIPYILTYWFHW